jgi:molecular chaperone GrpE
MRRVGSDYMDDKKKEKKDAGKTSLDKPDDAFFFDKKNDEVEKCAIHVDNPFWPKTNIGDSIINKATDKETHAKHSANEETKKLSDMDELPQQLVHPKCNSISDMEDRLKRLAADFENFKKRTDREHMSLKDNASAVLLSKILPITDEFGIAVAHAEKASDNEFKQGIEMIYRKLIETLKKEGVEEMKALGEKFDPYLHDAIKAETGEKEDKVVEVLQKGYLFKGKVLRHAKVVVSKKEK